MIRYSEYHYNFSWALFAKNGSVKSPIQKRKKVSLAILPKFLDQFCVQLILKSFKGLDKTYHNVRHVAQYAFISASVPVIHLLKIDELGHSCTKLPLLN